MSTTVEEIHRRIAGETELGFQSGWIGGVARDGVKIYDHVECVSGLYPIVNGNADAIEFAHLPLFVPERRVYTFRYANAGILGRKSAADRENSTAAGLINRGLEGSNDALFRGNPLCRASATQFKRHERLETGAQHQIPHAGLAGNDLIEGIGRLPEGSRDPQ